MKIGILMTTSPEHQNSQTVCALATALLAAQNEVKLFLMDDGVYTVDKNRADGLPAQMNSLLEKKLQVTICTQSAEKRGLSEAGCLSGIAWYSQAELSKIVSESERFLSFGA